MFFPGISFSSIIDRHVFGFFGPRGQRSRYRQISFVSHSPLSGPS